MTPPKRFRFFVRGKLRPLDEVLIRAQIRAVAPKLVPDRRYGSRGFRAVWRNGLQARRRNHWLAAVRPFIKRRVEPP